MACDHNLLMKNVMDSIQQIICFKSCKILCDNLRKAYASLPTMEKKDN